MDHLYDIGDTPDFQQTGARYSGIVQPTSSVGGTAGQTHIIDAETNEDYCLNTANVIALSSFERTVIWPLTGGSPDIVDVLPFDARLGELNNRWGHYLPDGTRCQPHALVNCFVLLEKGKPPVTAVYGFKDTGFRVGRDYRESCDRVRLEVDGRMTRSVGALWALSTEPARKGKGAYFLPKYTLLGKLGDKGGPPIELVRKAQELRNKFREEEDKLQRVRPGAPPVQGRAALPSPVGYQPYGMPPGPAPQIETGRRAEGPSPFPKRPAPAAV